MIRTDVIIIGGGPSGSACAWRLHQQKIDCLVIDQKQFPRFKPCAGWVTADVLKDMDFKIPEYPHGFSVIQNFQATIWGIRLRMPGATYAIQRIEFDDWLLKRADVPIYQHTVKNITETSDGYEIDGEFSAKYLVGAGGTHCPVYKTLFKAEDPRPKEDLIVAQEDEFQYDFTDGIGRLWFLENKLPGYSWYVPKANGYLNVGVGGSAEKLKANGDSLKNHWNLLVEKLDRLGLVKKSYDYKPTGHSYYLRQRAANVRNGNAFLVGDSAGLATLDMGEGISPAIKSGLRAADSICTGSPYSVKSIPRFSLPFPFNIRLS
jgi:menaquinone-9 beta-reductase